MTRYSKLDDRFRDKGNMIRSGDPRIADLWRHLCNDGRTVGHSLVKQPRGVDPEFAVGFRKTALYYLPVFTQVPPTFDGDGNPVPPRHVGSLAFGGRDDQLLAYAVLAGELAVLWWASVGDDFNVTDACLRDFPIGLGALNGARDELLELAMELEAAAQSTENLLFSNYAGWMNGSWDLRTMRGFTRQIDRLVLTTLGLEDLWPAVEAALVRFSKSTGEATNVERGLDWRTR